jgi:hypothetical protein
MFSLILAIAATALSAYGTIMQGVQAQKTAEYNAQVAEQQAQAARRKAAYEEETRRREGKELKSRQMVAAAKSGATLESFKDIFLKTATDTELDALVIRYGGQIESARNINEANLLRAQGKQAKKTSLIKTGTTLLTGGQRAYDIYKGL